MGEERQDLEQRTQEESPFWPWMTGIVGFALVLVGFSIWFIQRKGTVAVWIPLALGALGLLVCVGFYRRVLWEFFRSRAFASAFSTGVVAFSIVGLIAVGNYIAYRRLKGPWTRWDMTKTRLYSLSPQTQKVLRELKKDIKITAFYPPDEVMFVELSKARQLLREYEARSRRVKVDIIDPDLHPEKAKEYNITFYPKIVVEAGEKRETLSAANEEDITNAILKVTRERNPKVYFLKGHGERDPDSASSGGMNTARRVLERKLYDVDTLTLIGKNAVPEDCSLLIIAGPRAKLQPSEVEAIKEYLGRGGSLLVMVDPPPAADVNEILRDYGLETPPEVVYDPDINVQGAPTFPAVLQYGYHDITRDLPLTLYLEARPVVKQGSPPSNLSITELAQTSSGSYALPKKGDLFQEATQGEAASAPTTKRQGPLSVVTIVWDTSNEPSPSSEEKKEETQPPKRKMRLAVCGDSDFATDQLIPVGGNGPLFLNLVNWLAHEEKLIAIPAKEPQDVRITPTNRQIALMALVSLIFTPLSIVIAGTIVWLVRR